MKPWAAKWPFGIDILLRALSYDRKDRLLDLFLEIVDGSGYTFEQSALGAWGINTTEPENIKAVLSTNVNGESSPTREQHVHPIKLTAAKSDRLSPWFT